VRELGLRLIRLHDLRHLSASLQFAAGVELTIVSKRLGHRITSDIYGHLLEGTGRPASDAAAALIPRAGATHTPKEDGVITRDGL
jgi:integrase